MVNEDICAFCRMAVSERRFAAQVVTVGGRAEFYDDIGCLVDWLAENGQPEGAGIFVVDFTTGRWLTATGAGYVRSPRLPTPMGHGLAAFADREAAQAATRELGGEVVGWDDLVAEAR